MTRLIRVLLVGDFANDMASIVAVLQRAGFDPDANLVETAEAMETALEVTEWDAIKDFDGVISSWNEAAERLYGWTSAEAVGRHISIVVPPRPNNELERIMLRLRGGGRIQPFQTIRRRKDSREFPASLCISLIRGSGGNLIGAASFARNITDKMQLDEQLRTSESRFRCLFPSDVVAMGCWNIDGRITDANGASLRLLGCPRAELEAGKIRWIDITPPEYEPLDALALEELRKTGVSSPFEKKYFRKDRSRAPVLIAAAVFREGIANPGTHLAVDLSEQKQNETARQQQAQILHSILSSMGDGVIVTDEHGQFLQFNPAAEQILGIGMVDLDPTNWSERYGLYLPDQITLYPPHDLPLTRAMHGESMPATEVFIRNDTRPHGVWASVSASPLRDEAGRIGGGVIVFQDITERKRAEEAQRHLASQRDDLVRRLEMQINRLPLAYLMCDAEMRVREWNPAAEQTFGYTKEEMVGRVAFDLIVPNPIAGDLRAIVRRLRDGDMNAHSVNDNRTKDGRIITCEWYNTPFMNSDGDFVGTISVARDITARKQAEDALKDSEERIRLLLESTAEAIYGIDQKGDCTFANPACAALLGFSKSSMLIGKNMHALMHHHRAEGTFYPEDECNLHSGTRCGNGTHVDDDTFWRIDGTAFAGECWSFPVRRQGDVIGAVVTMLDISARKALEKQLRQSQSMEAVGQLAGGIAHDFINVLTSINVYSHLLAISMASDNAAQQLLMELGKVTERSASLTRQLLAVSRKQSLDRQSVCLNDVVSKAEQLLRRVVGPDIQFVTVLDARLDTVKADPEQIERVLLNLVLNARDAMPRGGTLSIETKNVSPDEITFHDNVDLPHERYVMLTVTDSGIGMSREVKRHIFEPFFTTKAPGSGSGLGLAAVHDIVRQSEGHIWVESEPRRGACFKIYLPRTEQLAGLRGSSQEIAARPRGTEAILLVKDDEAFTSDLKCGTRHDLTTP